MRCLDETGEPKQSFRSLLGNDPGVGRAGAAAAPATKRRRELETEAVLLLLSWIREEGGKKPKRYGAKPLGRHLAGRDMWEMISPLRFGEALVTTAREEEDNNRIKSVRQLDIRQPNMLS